jgi:uncharacterized protein YbjT (DUF2867 family)
MLRSSRPLLVAGATGYVGSRLISRLLEAGYPVRALARAPDKLSSRPWSQHPDLQIVRGDLLDAPSLRRAVAGCRAVYYLVHSMHPGVADYAATDRTAADNLVAAAEQAGLERIIYLGGLGDEQASLSHHLRSRSEVGRILAAGPVPVTVFRAAMIIGSGSASFEILRYLVDRLPLMVTPRWVGTRCQPIGIRNVLHYLVACLDVPETIGQSFDIGCPEIVSYRQLMRLYAEEAGLRRRLIIPVPVLTPRLSSYWIHLVTPVPAAIARPLAEGLSSPVVCQETRIRALIPQSLFDCRTAIRLALERLREQQVESTWFDAGSIPPAEWSIPGDPHWAGGAVYQDARRIVIAAEPERVWQVVSRIGGSSGWYYADWLWRLRGLLDRLVGGIGLRRGRRSQDDLSVGDALDFWRVAGLNRLVSLLLVAEMKLPGQATLSFELLPAGAGRTELRQIARFLPRGLPGLMYWWLVAPFHSYVFNGMLRGIATAIRRPVLEGPSQLPGGPP